MLATGPLLLLQALTGPRGAATLFCMHPTSGALVRFIKGEASRPERRVIVLHFLRGCPECAARLASLPEAAVVLAFLSLPLER